MNISDALRLAAALLAIEEVKDIAAEAIAASRDQAPRIGGDRDSADVLNDLIEALEQASHDRD